MTAHLRCVVLDDFADFAATAADWRSVPGLDLVTVAEHPQNDEDLVALLSEADVVVTLRERIAFPRDVLERLPRLRLIVASGMRTTVIDLAAARELGITVSGTASEASGPVELTWGLLLALARNIVPEANAIRDGGWQSSVGIDLFGATLGIIGLGRIGAAVAHIARAFGMRVVAWSENLTPERCADVAVERAGSLDELMSVADIVTVHTRLSNRTRGLVDAQRIALMKPTALLVNTSRSAIVREAALIDALENGVIAGAALDVFDREPLAADDPIRRAPHLIATGHLGYVTERNLTLAYTHAVEAINAHRRGAPIRVMTAIG